MYQWKYTTNFKKLTVMIAKIAISALIMSTLLSCQSDKAVDLSWVVPNCINSDLYRFYIPKNFKPMYAKSDRVFNFSVGVPSEGLPFQKIGTDAQNEVRVVVSAVSTKQKMIGMQILNKIVTNNKNHLSEYKYMGKINEFYKYKHGRETYYIKRQNNKDAIVIYENGDVLDGFMSYRQLNNNIELNYNYSTNINVEQWYILDQSILELMHSFQLLYKKNCNNKCT